MVVRQSGARHIAKHFKDHIRRRDNYTCQLCGEPGYEVDHIAPYAISGETKPETSRVLCVKCNRATRLPRKDALLPLAEFYAQIEAELSATHKMSCASNAP